MPLVRQARRCPARQPRRTGFHGTDKECGQKRSKRGNTAGDDQHGGEPGGKAAAGDLDQRSPGSRPHVLQRAGNVAGDDSRDDDLGTARDGTGKSGCRNGSDEMRLRPARQHAPRPVIPVTRPMNRSVPLMPDATPPRSGRMTLIDTFAVSPLSNPAPHPVTSMPMAITA